MTLLASAAEGAWPGVEQADEENANSAAEERRPGVAPGVDPMDDDTGKHESRPTCDEVVGMGPVALEMVDVEERDDGWLRRGIRAVRSRSHAPVSASF
jgi:hypothetical protein